MRNLAVLIAAVCISGCCHRCKEDTATRFHDDGRAKPVVAMPAMLDTTSFDVPWSISDEMTATIAELVGMRGQIYIKTGEDLAITSNPFSGDLSWIKHEFNGNEFVVFLELAQHELVPFSKQADVNESSNSLETAIRVRVVDLRGSDPKIVLQELIKDSYYIPKTILPIDYNLASWGTPEYQTSPMHTAHQRIVREIASRVSEYILLAKSR